MIDPCFSSLPALQLADVHARLQAEGDVTRRVVEANGVPMGPFRLTLLLGHGLGKILIEALGAGGEVDLSVDANDLPETNFHLRLKESQKRLSTSICFGSFKVDIIIQSL